MYDFNIDQVISDAKNFDSIKETLFENSPKELESFFKHQKYVVKAAGPFKVVYVSATSNVTAHPKQSVYLPVGYLVTGGGARANWGGWGNLLTGTYPIYGSLHGWQAEAKDHSVSDPASVTVWAIGISA